MRDEEGWDSLKNKKITEETATRTIEHDGTTEMRDKRGTKMEESRVGMDEEG